MQHNLAAQPSRDGGTLLAAQLCLCLEGNCSCDGGMDALCCSVKAAAGEPTQNCGSDAGSRVPAAEGWRRWPSMVLDGPGCMAGAAPTAFKKAGCGMCGCEEGCTSLICTSLCTTERLAVMCGDDRAEGCECAWPLASLGLFSHSAHGYKSVEIGEHKVHVWVDWLWVHSLQVLADF